MENQSIIGDVATQGDCYRADAKCALRRALPAVANPRHGSGFRHSYAPLVSALVIFAATSFWTDGRDEMETADYADRPSLTVIRSVRGERGWEI